MIGEYENKLLKLNSDLAGKKKGSTVSIKVDPDGTPIDRYWRNRLNDAKVDNCVEFVESVEFVELEDSSGKQEKSVAKRTKSKK